MPNLEIKSRNTVSENIGLKSRGEKKNILFGDVAPFNSLSENVGGFFEILMHGFFRQAIRPENLEAFSFFNHNRDLVLAATKNGEMILEEKTNALTHETELKGDTQISRDMIAHANAKRIYRMSFSYTNYPEAEIWRNDGDRVICQLEPDGCKRLYDASPVPFPAYKETSLGMRNLPGFGKDREHDEELTALVRAEKSLPFTRTDLEALNRLSIKINKALEKSIANGTASTDGAKPQDARHAEIEAMKLRMKGISA